VVKVSFQQNDHLQNERLEWHDHLNLVEEEEMQVCVVDMQHDEVVEQEVVEKMLHLVTVVRGVVICVAWQQVVQEMQL
jgi:hypothetical protein